MKSVWESTALKYPSPEGELKREIVVVGGGIAGYLTAFFLSEKGAKVTLLEAASLFSGVTRGTTAHIEALQGLVYSDLIKKSPETAGLYFESQQRAVPKYHSLIEKYKIECGFEIEDDYLYSMKSAEKIKREYDALKALGADALYLDSPEIFGNKARAALMLPGQARFDPLKFLSGLPAKFEIFERARVIEADLKKKILSTEKATVKAEKIVIATNFPIVDFPGAYFLRMYKSTSYAVAVSGSPELGGMYQTDEEDGYTFRNHGDLLIACGLDHRTGRASPEKYEKLIETAKTIAAGEFVAAWSSNDCVTFDGLPYIGRYSKKAPDSYVITGFNKWGMATAITGAELLTNLIYGLPDRFEDVFFLGKAFFGRGRVHKKRPFRLKQSRPQKYPAAFENRRFTFEGRRRDSLFQREKARRVQRYRRADPSLFSPLPAPRLSAYFQSQHFDVGLPLPRLAV